MQEDLDGLAAFLAVAETRSFRRAGEQLRVTASAVSQTIRHLETRLHLQLFARTTRSVALTEAGEPLFNGIRPAFADVRLRSSTFSAIAHARDDVAESTVVAHYQGLLMRASTIEKAARISAAS